MKLIEKTLSFFENSKINLDTWLISFFALIALRVMTEFLIFSLKSQTLLSFISFFLHNFLFFLLLYLVLLIVFTKILKEDIKKIASVLLWGYWLILLPPIIDRIAFGEKDVWSFYFFGGPKQLLEGFFTFFGENITVGITLGTRVVFGLVFLLALVYVFLKTANWRKVLITAGIFYGIVFVFGSFPSLVGIFLKFFGGKDFLAINGTDIASIFLVPVELFSFKDSIVRVALTYRLNLIYGILIFIFLAIWQWAGDREKFIALFKNIRYPQMIFNGGLLFLGLGLGWFYYPQNFTGDFFSFLIVINLVLMVFCAWFYSVFINDLNDIEIDKQTNNQRPLIKKVFSLKEYRKYAHVFLVGSLLLAGAVNVKILLLIVCYHFLTLVYSAHPFRLKRIVFVASALSSLASLLFLFIGFLVFAEGQSLKELPFSIGLLLFLSFTLIIPLKDLKDAKSDRVNRVYTLPALIGVKNARSVLATLLFLLYFFSVYIINETRLFLPALIFGSASFWVVSSEKFPVKNLNWWVLLAVVLYGFSILKIIFL